MNKLIPVFLAAMGALLLSSGWWPSYLQFGGGGLTLTYIRVPKEIVQILISAALFGTALHVILASKYEPKDKYWAYAIVGILVGFWFKSN